MKRLVLIIILSFIPSISFGVTATWLAPTTNADGTQLNDLSGYKLYWGTQSGVYDNVIDVGNANTYTWSPSVPEGSDIFASVTAYDTSGNESVKSNEATCTLPIVAPSAPTELILQ